MTAQEVGMGLYVTALGSPSEQQAFTPTTEAFQQESLGTAFYHI